MFSERRAVYLFHGGVVWLIAGAVYFLVAVEGPWRYLLPPGKPIAVHSLLTLLAGELLGIAIYLALKIGDQFPENRSLHVMLPLFVSAVGGVWYAQTIATPALYPGGAVLPIRSETLRMVTGAILGLLVTPVIIVRSTRMSVRLGFRQPVAQERDARWG